jgi:hypothetical protein
MEDKKLTFFKIVFGQAEGFVCAVKREPGTRTFEEYFFQYPQEAPQLVEFCNQYSFTHDVYYCPQVFDRRKRQKEHVLTCPSAWSDLDTCPPGELLVEPSITIQSSPGRYQALWIFQEPIDPSDAEDISRRIAYYHSDEGADRSGWDLTQLLRVPFTQNHKYVHAGTPTVTILKTGKIDYKKTDFDKYPQASGYEFTDVPFPDEVPNAADVIENHRESFKPQIWMLLNETPEEDWSRALWQLEMLLAEAGLSREEIFAIAAAAKCNKYARDGRSNKLLWKDVCKAYAVNQSHAVELATGPVNDVDFLIPLLTDEEREAMAAKKTIVEDYVEWAKTLGDAAWQYHQAGAFVILSSMLAGTVRLPTSYGIVVPNLWFMILADTTLTRKTTAMDIAMDLVVEVDSDCMLATDGSLEGLMTSLSMRPGRPSVFLRDEFSGLLEAMTKKDYYAGMAEALTKLYDGKYQKRVLRKETLEVKEPVLVMFAGGIRTRILELLTVEHVASGFMPRFVFIAAESDLNRLKPLGPPTDQSVGQRQQIIDEFRRLHNFYNKDQLVQIDGKTLSMPKKWDARLTPEAWMRYNELETKMLDSGLKSLHADLMTPTFDRLSKSGLKCATLLAAARNKGQEVIVELEDILHAFYYIEQWRTYTVMVMQNVGKSSNERQLERIYQAIKSHPNILRSAVMQKYHLTAREADASLSTLEQRGLIIRQRSGKSERLSAVVGGKRG